MMMNKRGNLNWKFEKDGLDLQGGYSNQKPVKSGPSKEDYRIEKREGFSDPKMFLRVLFHWEWLTFRKRSRKVDFFLI